MTVIRFVLKFMNTLGKFKKAAYATKLFYRYFMPLMKAMIGLLRKHGEKANPGYGTICTKAYFEQESKKAQNVPSYLNTFLRLNLNIWTSAETAWIPDDVFMRGSDPIPYEKLPSLPAFGGLDLASTQDLTAFALLFRDDECDCFYLIVHQFVNQDKADSKKLSAGIDYHRFAKDGHITVTPGNVTDFRYVKEHIVDACSKYDVRSIGYDPKVLYLHR